MKTRIYATPAVKGLKTTVVVLRGLGINSGKVQHDFIHSTPTSDTQKTLVWVEEGLGDSEVKLCRHRIIAGILNLNRIPQK